MAYIQIAGNCSNIELKYTAAGMAMAKFSIAETRKKNDEKITTWFNVIAFDKLAEHIAGSVDKGKRLTVVGRIESDDYEKDGKKVKNYQVVAEEVSVSLKWEALDGSTAPTEQEIGEEPF